MFINMNNASISYRLKKKVFFTDISKKNTIKKSSYKSTSAERFITYNIFVIIDSPSTSKKKSKDLLKILSILIAD